MPKNSAWKFVVSERRARGVATRPGSPGALWAQDPEDQTDTRWASPHRGCPRKPAHRLQIRVLNAAGSHEINVAFATLARERPDALFVVADPLFVGRRVQLTHLASRHAIPAAYSTRDFPEAGGLMSYGTNVTDAWRQAVRNFAKTEAGR